MNWSWELHKDRGMTPEERARRVPRAVSRKLQDKYIAEAIRQARTEALEAAALECDSLRKQWAKGNGEAALGDAAAAIRVLK